MSYQDRDNRGKERVAKVLSMLLLRDWIAIQIGQEVWPQNFRKILGQQRAPYRIRWMADVLAMKGDACHLVEIKSGNNYPNYGIEVECLMSLEVQEQLAPVLIVWPDFRVSSVSDLEGLERTLGEPGRGSGTPYWKYQKEIVPTVEFDSCFGLAEPF